MNKVDRYPESCKSINCGEINCTGCPYKPFLDEYNKYRDGINNKKHLDDKVIISFVTQ